MDIDKLLKQFEFLIQEIEDEVDLLDKNTSKGMARMPDLIGKIERFLPDWFYFIEQTEIGNNEMVLDICKDIMEGIQASDTVLLTDALIYGLQSLMVEYWNVINEALNDE